MARRGRCKCGNILTFAKGPQGFKVTCDACGAVVRLRPKSPRTAARVARLRLSRRLAGLGVSPEAQTDSAADAEPPAPTATAPSARDTPTAVETPAEVPPAAPGAAWLAAALAGLLIGVGAVVTLWWLFFGGTAT